MRFVLKLTLLLLFFPFATTAQTEIKVMSYNIRFDRKEDGENWWEKRKQRVADLMNFYYADFIGGQEVLPQQLKYLTDSLKGYDYIGVGRDDGKQKGEHSCIWYKKERFELIRQSTFWLSPNPDSIVKGWDAAIKRVCTYGLFRDKKTKQYCWVFNTHFDHIGKQARLESAKLITRKIRELNTKNYPVIVTGDFNSRPEEEPAQYMLKHMRNSRDASAVVHGNADTWNGFKFNEKPDGCIDYIFISNDPRVKVKNFGTLTDSYDMKYPSDHFPIMATLLLEK